MNNDKIEKWFEIIDRELIRLHDAVSTDGCYELYDFSQSLKWIIDDINLYSLQSQYSEKVDLYLCILRRIYIEPYCTSMLINASFDDVNRLYTLHYQLYYSDNTPRKDKTVTELYDDNMFVNCGISIDEVKDLYSNVSKSSHGDNASLTWFSSKIQRERYFYKGVHYDESEKMRWFDMKIKHRLEKLQLYNPTADYKHNGVMIDNFINDLREKYESVDISKDVIVENDKSIEAKFANIQSEIIKCIEEARVSILIVIAWFTNQAIENAILEKKKQGLRIEIATYNDGVNKKHGVNLTGLDHVKIRGSRGGIMHDKFCIIDNQVVITGSYNWSDGAEKRNDENITIIRDNNIATDYSVEFRRLKPIQ